MSILGELTAFNAGQWVTLYTLDLTVFGGDLLRFHAGVNDVYEPVVFGGHEYTPFPVEATGFAVSSTGAVARPKFRVSNVNGAITSLLLQTGGIEGARFTRIRTKVKFLDAVNFAGGNPTADPLAKLPDDVFYISQKVTENPDVVEFELAPSTDLQGVMVPRRQINANYCPHVYRGEVCGYAGAPVATADGVPTNDAALDRCGKKLGDCKLRFGANGELPFGGFPACGLVRFT